MEIINNIFLGLPHNGIDKDWLGKTKIKSILIVSDDQPILYPDSFEYMRITINSEPLCSSRRYYYKMGIYIETNRKKGRILVYCDNERTKSYVAVLSYLMKYKRMSLSKGKKLLETKIYKLVKISREIRMNLNDYWACLERRRIKKKMVLDMNIEEAMSSYSHYDPSQSPNLSRIQFPGTNQNMLFQRSQYKWKGRKTLTNITTSCKKCWSPSITGSLFNSSCSKGDSRNSHHMNSLKNSSLLLESPLHSGKIWDKRLKILKFNRKKREKKAISVIPSVPSHFKKLRVDIVASFETQINDSIANEPEEKVENMLNYFSLKQGLEVTNSNKEQFFKTDSQKNSLLQSKTKILRLYKKPKKGKGRKLCSKSQLNKLLLMK